MICKNLNIQNSFDGKVTLTVELTNKVALERLYKLTEVDLLDIDIDKHRNKRSNSANAALWVLLKRLADVLGTSKDELYLHFLEQYGTCTYIAVHPNAVDMVKQKWRASRELGEVIVNGRKRIQLECYYGSSLMNSKDFSILLQGVIDECEAQGLEGLTPKEFDRLIGLIDKKEG